MTKVAPDGFIRCPFCASAHVTMGQRPLRKHVKYYVKCDVCWAQGPATFDRTRAHAGWNERMYGDVNASAAWTQEERTGGPQVAEWTERQKPERDRGETP